MSVGHRRDEDVWPPTSFECTQPYKTLEGRLVLHVNIYRGRVLCRDLKALLTVIQVWLPHWQDKDWVPAASVRMDAPEPTAFQVVGFLYLDRLSDQYGPPNSSDVLDDAQITGSAGMGPYAADIAV